MSQADPAKLLCRLGNLREAAAAAAAAAKALEEAVASAAESVEPVGDEGVVTVKWGQEQVLACTRARTSMCGPVPDGHTRCPLRIGCSLFEAPQGFVHHLIFVQCW